VGRVWPRHGHRGRPLNAGVSWHLMSSDLAISATGGIAREARCVVLYARVADGVSPDQGYAIRDTFNNAETIGWWFVNPGSFLAVFAWEASGAERALSCEASVKQLSVEHPSWPSVSVGVAEGVLFGAFTRAGILESMPTGAVVLAAMQRASANAS
jgi:hypothetical protein